MRKRGMALFLSLLLLLAPACSPAEGGADWERDTDISSELEYEDSMELLYAEKFSVDFIRAALPSSQSIAANVTL